jgi:glycosyltransferase involved in cell wall biosynthesis
VNVLIPFNTVALYGMERTVIELFDVLRPGIAPHFLMSYSTLREGRAVLTDVQRRGLSHSFFSDTAGWPTIGKPRSLRQLWGMLVAMVKGNRDVLRAAIRADAIYLSGIRYSYFAMVGCLYCMVTRKRIIYHFHDLVTTKSTALWLLRLVVDDFIHSSHIGYRLVTEANPWLLKRNNHIIPLHVNVALKDGDGDPLPQSCAQGERVILFAGQVASHKGIDLLLNAMGRIGAEFPDVVLVVIGSCSPEFEPRFKDLLASEGLAGRVRYLGYREDIPRFMTNAYVYVHPTPPSRVLESFGRGVLEAMACGVPTVCFRCGALQDLVVDRETGLVCDREDSGCLADNLRRILNDRLFRDRCGANALNRYRTEYSSQRVVARWRTVFGTVAA